MLQEEQEEGQGNRTVECMEEKSFKKPLKSFKFQTDNFIFAHRGNRETQVYGVGESHMVRNSL